MTQPIIQIIITAGGTSESIDGIRKLTNSSTGRLGWQCLLATICDFNLKKQCVRIHYIHTHSAFIGTLDTADEKLVNFIEADTNQAVYHSVNELTTQQKIDYFIHTMAISDFHYKFSISINQLCETISKRIKYDKNIDCESIKEILKNPENILSTETKLSSKEGIYMAFDPAPKVISLIKKNNPETFLIGFKLLHNVGEEELVQAAQKLREKNNCDMVFANLLSQTDNKGHTGILIASGQIIARPIGKAPIAQTIVRKMQEYRTKNI